MSHAPNAMCEIAIIKAKVGEPEGEPEWEG